jgi:ribosomal protein S18 acetylase RimI-like enzyme
VAQQEEGRVSYLVAWQGEKAVGYGLLHWAGPRDTEIAARLPGCPEIFMLGVPEILRSQGIGSLLLTGLEEIAAERGFTRVGLGVALDNHRARRLYERAGYGRVGAPLYIDRWHWVDSSGQTHIEEDRCEFLVKPLATA